MFSDLANLTYEERSRLFCDPDAAREYIEAVRWGGEPFCPHCANIGAYALTPKKGSSTRKGVYKCAACRKQFTVTVGTVFEGSHLGLHKWLRAIYLMCDSKKGISANQLMRELQVQYKTAWFLCHRIRKAMEKEPMRSKLGGPRDDNGRTVAGQVEADETFVGGKVRGKGRKAGWANKAIVFTLIDRHGEARSFHVDDRKATTLQRTIQREVHGLTHILSDEHKGYEGLDSWFSGHGSVTHSKGEYVRGVIHTNFAESFFSLLKRGIVGAFHHVSKKHLPRYLEEFDFRWNRRQDTDGERMVDAIRGGDGKRLMYRAPKQALARA